MAPPRYLYANMDSKNTPITNESRTQLPQVCEPCRSLISHVHSGPRTSLRLKHCQTFTALKDSAAAGCGVCSQFLKGRSSSRQVEAAFGSDFPERNAAVRIPHALLRIVYNKGDLDSDHDAQHEENEIFLQFGIQIEPTNTIVISEEYSEGSTKDALPLCKAWFQDCCTNHTTCAPSSPRFKPTRVIYVGGGGPRLVLADEVAPDIPFASLSHCWGKLKFRTLTQSALQEFRRRIPPESLHKTFRDAIAICQYMGLDYIWIDSLCIVQDSKEDWEKESALMSKVYGECDLNIAATAAEDGRFGCFFDRPHDWLCQVTLTGNVHDQRYNILPKHWAEPERNALGCRGWVVQERYLSRRIIHFAESQVFWECDNRACCEAFPTENLSRMATNPSYHFCLIRRPLTKSIWLSLLDRYSRSLLTKSSDRLIAVAGLVEAIQNVTHEEYIAGMWRGDLENPTYLAWEAQPGCTRISTSTSPSWSWASIMGPVERPEECNFNLIRKVEVDFHKITYERNSANPYVDVKNAVLRLKCKELYHATLTYKGSLDRSLCLTGTSHTFELGQAGGLDCPNEGHREYIVEAYLLPLGIANSSLLLALMLERVGEQPGQFRRIGLSQSKDFRPPGITENGYNLFKSQTDLFSELVHGTSGIIKYIIDLL